MTTANLPAIPVKVGWQPSGIGEMAGVPYLYVSSKDMLWTFWKDFGLVIERRES